MEKLDLFGFRGEYDFVYLPFDKRTWLNVGYSFVNFKTPVLAAQCMTVFKDLKLEASVDACSKIAQTCVASIQGLSKNVEFHSHTATQGSRHPVHRPLVLTTDCVRIIAPPARFSRGRRRRGY